MWKRMMLYEILRRVHQPQLQIHESRMWLEAYIEAYRSCHIAIVDHMEYTHTPHAQSALLVLLVPCKSSLLFS